MDTLQGILFLLLITLAFALFPSAGADQTEGHKCTVLASVLPFGGHMIPILSLGQELQSRGHEVCVASLPLSETFPRALINKYGLTFLPAPTDYTYDQWNAELEGLGQNDENPMNEVWGVLTGMRRRDGYLSRFLKSEAPKLHNVRLLIGDIFCIWSINMMNKELPGNIPIIYNAPTYDPFRRPFWPHPVHSSGLSKSMSFKERVLNELLAGFVEVLIRNSPKLLRSIEEEYFGAHVGPLPYPGERWPLLLDSAPGFDYPVASGPLVQYVGHMIPETSGEVIPQPLQDWLDSKAVANHPVVLVSMGSHVHLSDKQGSAILEGLIATGLPAVWSLRSRNRGFLEGVKLPEHIRLEEWFPQRKLLEHPDVAVMIGHCGTGGVHEALVNSVPVVCLPVHGDHPDTAARLRDSGAGLTLAFRTFNASDLTNAVNAIVTEKDLTSMRQTHNAFAQAAIKVSKYLKAAGGPKKAANFAEMVMEIGCDHLVTEDQRMSWMVRNKLDIYSFLLASSIGLLLVTRQLCRACGLVTKKGKVSKVKAS